MNELMSMVGFVLLPSFTLGVLTKSGSSVNYDEVVIPVSLESNLGLWYNYMLGWAPREDIFGITSGGFSASIFLTASSMLNFGFSVEILGRIIAGGAPEGTGLSRSCVWIFGSLVSWGGAIVPEQPYLLDKEAKCPAISFDGRF